MKSLKTLLQEVTAGIKAWANANFSLGTHVHGNVTNDGKVGTTANKPLITGTGGVVQAGSFGNQANTFCEGNDSRLSDARTPVAHTHLTADVTDLLNTAHEWTGDNTYTTPVNYKSTHTLGNLPVSVDAQQAFRILDSAGTNFLCDTASFQNTTASGLRFTIRDKFDSNGFSPSGTNRSSYLHFLQNANSQSYLQWDGYTKNNVIPLTTNTYDLGSSSYQWNNLYAKNYFYNGTAWGLDKANTWSGSNGFSLLSLFNNSVTYNEAPSSNVELPSIRIFGGGKYAGAFDYLWRTTGENVIRLSLGSYKSDGSFGYWACNFGVPRDFSNGGKFGTPAFYPNTDGYNLGDSTHRWKTLNGINPGALSLPNLDSTVSLTTTLQAAIDKTQTVNSWTANFTGILCINWITKNLMGPYRCSVYNASDIKNATWGQTFWADNVWYFIVSFPVQNGKTYYFDNTFTRTSEDSAHIVHSANAIYTLGNV